MPLDAIVARLGGDEFVVAAPCSHSHDSVTTLVEKLYSALVGPMETGGQEVLVHASVGISRYADDGASREALLQNADIARYRVKQDGRNSFRFYQKEMASQVRERMTIGDSLYRSLERRGYKLHY